MKSEQVNKIVIPMGDNYKFVQYTYRYLPDDVKKVKTERAERSSDSFTEISKTKKTIRDANGIAIGWIAEHVYKKKEAN